MTYGQWLELKLKIVKNSANEKSTLNAIKEDLGPKDFNTTFT